MRFLYPVFIAAYTALLHLISPFHRKASLWVKGRKNWQKRYQSDFVKKGPVLWVHCASLGEFEQGRPVIEAFRSDKAEWQIVLSFFSPSGYELRKNYDKADIVVYLPADTAQNAASFLDIFQPDAAIFVKYEFWANYLKTLKARRVQTFLISALFRPEQAFFKFYGAFWREMLDCFTHIFVQDQASAHLLQKAGYLRHSVAGDTRVDRVLQLAAQAGPVEGITTFLANSGNRLVLIVGSSWPKDEALLAEVLNKAFFRENYCCILAPHEPSASNIRRLEHLFPETLLYSRLNKKPTQASVLVIDNVGMLNRLYQYGDLAYIGGGFGKGIHNTLEPAAFGLPIIFGPKYKKFEEARQFVALNGAFSVSDADALENLLLAFLKEETKKNAGEAVKIYLQHNKGATERIIRFFHH